MSFPLILIWVIVMYFLGDYISNYIFYRIQYKLETVLDIVKYEIFSAVLISSFTIAPIFYFTNHKDIIPFIFASFVFMHFMISYMMISAPISSKKTVPLFYLVQISSLILVITITL